MSLRTTLHSPPDARATCAKALEALARRSRSAAELGRWLERRGHLRANIDLALTRLTELGYLDDASYALAFVRSGTARRMSRRRLQGDLARRGVGRDAITAAIAAVFDVEGVDEDAMLEEVAVRKLRSLAALSPEVRDRRLRACLARRGYDTDLIRRTVVRLTRGGD